MANTRYGEIVGNKLRTYREDMGKTQEELAKELFINRSTLSLIEKGAQTPDLELLVRILQLTKMDFMQMLELKFRSFVVVDTNIIFNRPMKLKAIVEDADRVYIPDVVKNELNYQKDRGMGAKKTNASQCLNILIELKESQSIEFLECSDVGNNDDKIFKCAKRVAESHQNDYVYLLTDDKDFRLKDPGKLTNLKVINSQEYERIFKVDTNYDMAGSQKFFSSVFKRDVDMAKQLSEGNIDVNVIDGRSGLTPLIQAIRNKDIAMVRFLISLPRIDINAVDSKKYCLPPISHAIQMNNMEIIRMLIQSGADVNEPSMADKNPYNTPLMIAAWHGRLDIARLLVESGACVNQSDKGNGFTPLIKAAFQNQVELVRFLLNSGADRTICSFERKTALDYAYEKNNENQYKDVIDLLKSE